ncbi:MAG: hypothetical protein VXZ29_07000 [Pseudomonadota bacterium]|nr:hypothetical protein [Pseudomonadota bacterium]
MRVSEQLAGSILLFSTCIFNASQISAQNDEAIPDLSGIWDGGFSVRPVNGVDVPWGEDNFPNLNARALAYQEVWEETMAPKYDCQPASSPAIQYDPYAMQVTQWPDRVLFRYEKDDQLRTVWLDGREPEATDFSLQGFSVGHYEDGSLYVTTTHFVFDIAGFDDYNGIPSSAQKVVTERYWREGEELKLTLTVEDPMFLQEPTSYTTRWLPSGPDYRLQPYDCDPEASRTSVRFYPSKYD